jgi:hypothetical protein
MLFLKAIFRTKQKFLFNNSQEFKISDLKGYKHPLPQRSGMYYLNSPYIIFRGDEFHLNIDSTHLIPHQWCNEQILLELDMALESRVDEAIDIGWLLLLAFRCNWTNIKLSVGLNYKTFILTMQSFLLFNVWYFWLRSKLIMYATNIRHVLCFRIFLIVILIKFRSAI